MVNRPFLVGLWLFAATLLALASGRVQAQSGAGAGYGQLPLAFESNEGQSDSRVKFLCRGAGYGLFLTGSDTVLTLVRPAPRGKALAAKSDVLRFSLVGANPSPRIEAFEPSPGKSNYFIGSDPSHWRTNIPQYARVKAEQVYPGIDLVYYGRQRQLEYDFRVAPGADPAAIRFSVEGAQKASLNARGDLVLEMRGGDVIEQAPAIYQEAGGKREPVGGGFEMRRIGPGPGWAVGFRVAAYDRARPLVIDPALAYSTYLGGNPAANGDGCYGIAVNGSGNAYVTGYTSSMNFPTTAGAYQSKLSSGANGNVNAIVTELNATGTALVYSTYLGGGVIDNGYGIALDGSGNAYVTGYTQSSNFPTTAGAFQTSLSGTESAFVTKLNATGAALIYSTYLGGAGSFLGDGGYGIAVDGSGNAYVAGYTGSPSYPTTASAYQPKLAGNINAVVTKLNANGTALIYSTYLGGSNFDTGQDLALDGSGNTYITGQAYSPDFPTTAGAFQTILGGTNGNAFVTKLNATGTALIYSTLLGGANNDGGYGIAVDGSGNACVTGAATSSNFPTTAGAFQVTLSATSGNAFVTKVNATGAALVYSTFLGGGVYDTGSGIAVDSFGNAYVTGFADSPDFPTTPDAFQANLSSASGNAFVTKLNAAGSALIYSTLLGGSTEDSGNSVAVDGPGNAYVDGLARSADFPTTAGAFQRNLGGPTGNGFVAKLSLAIYTVTPSAGANGGISPNTQQLIASGSSAGFTAIPANGYIVNQWIVNGAVAQTGGTNYTLSNVTGNATVHVTFTPAGVTYTVTPSAGANGGISPNTQQIVESGSSVGFTATPSSGYVVNQWLVNGGLAQTGGTNYTLNNVLANTTVNVTFAPASLTYTVTPSAGANGTISPNTQQIVNSGSSAGFTATPAAGYMVNQWLANGTAAQTGGNSFTLSNVTVNTAVQVTFQPIVVFTVTPATGGNGVISPNIPQLVNSGSSAVFTATPSNGYVIDQWLLDGDSAQYGGSLYTLSNVTGNTAIEVIFAPVTVPYTVTPAAGANGSISPATVQTVNTGGGGGFTATPSSGYAVSQWLVNGRVAQTGGATYALFNVTADTTVQVTFVPFVALFSFTVSNAVVHSSDGQATVTVSRNFNAPATVDFQTVDDTAVDGVEYTGTGGTLSFAANQTQETINVPLLPDGAAPATNDFSIQLANPGAGATVGNPGSVAVTILNDETTISSLSVTPFTLPGTAPAATARSR